jgi:hypothetical protein
VRAEAKNFKLAYNAGAPGTQFSCFTSTKVQMLTPEALCAATMLERQVLSFLALLVQILTPEALCAARYTVYLLSSYQSTNNDT